MRYAAVKTMEVKISPHRAQGKPTEPTTTEISRLVDSRVKAFLRKHFAVKLSYEQALRLVLNDDPELKRLYARGGRRR